jgi:hypothetical protein
MTSGVRSLVLVSALRTESAPRVLLRSYSCAVLTKHQRTTASLRAESVGWVDSPVLEELSADHLFRVDADLDRRRTFGRTIPVDLDIAIVALSALVGLRVEYQIKRKRSG